MPALNTRAARWAQQASLRQQPQTWLASPNMKSGRVYSENTAADTPIGTATRCQTLTPCRQVACSGRRAHGGDVDLHEPADWLQTRNHAQGDGDQPDDVI
jgi:hypothetical protein